MEKRKEKNYKAELQQLEKENEELREELELARLRAENERLRRELNDYKYGRRWWSYTDNTITLCDSWTYHDA